jgi:hypothetical protein
MQIYTINNFKDFCDAIKGIGFCLAGNDNRIFNLTNYYSNNIKNHTGDSETDPWEWRIRSIKEVDFLVYGKLFYRKAGWITRDWLPKFLSIRRNRKTFDEMYQDGIISQMEKRIYDCIRQTDKISIHDLKNVLECKKGDYSKFNMALISLQMKLFITLYDETNKISMNGQTYGWPVTVFSTLEEKVGEYIVSEAYEIRTEDAFDAIYEHIKELNPYAQDKQVKNFIIG